MPWVLTAAETEAALGAYRDALATLHTVRAAASGADLARLLALRADLLSACADLGALTAYREALEVATDPAARAAAADAAGPGRDRGRRPATPPQLALAGLDLDGGDNDAALLLARGNLAFYLQRLRRGRRRGGDRGAPPASPSARGAGGCSTWSPCRACWRTTAASGSSGCGSSCATGCAGPTLAVGIFDSHLCVAEYLLYGPTPYDEVLELAAELRDTAERAGVLRAVAFAMALRGEAALLKGDLDLAETELHAAADLHHDLESPAGEAHSLQRLAEVHLARGDRAEATRLLQRALPLARWSSIGQHLLHRVYGCMIDAAPDLATARAVVDRAESTLGKEDRCMFCSIMLAVPAAQACADVGDLDEARRHLRAAERSEALWEGTAWQASLLEARAHIAAGRAPGRGGAAAARRGGGAVRRRRPTAGRGPLPARRRAVTAAGRRRQETVRRRGRQRRPRPRCGTDADPVAAAAGRPASSSTSSAIVPGQRPEQAAAPPPDPSRTRRSARRRRAAAGTAGPVRPGSRPGLRRPGQARRAPPGQQLGVAQRPGHAVRAHRVQPVAGVADQRPAGTDACADSRPEPRTWRSAPTRAARRQPVGQSDLPGQPGEGQAGGQAVVPGRAPVRRRRTGR